MPSAPRAELERVFREEHGRVVASLVRRFGDIDIAEEAVQEAVVVALQRWPEAGVPPNPGAWLTTTAGNKAIDRIRRESRRDMKHTHAALLGQQLEHHEPLLAEDDPVADDRLRLIFTCCHPALAQPVRVALTLRLLGGLSVGEIAQAFFVPETTMAQRLTRAKAKIKAANIPYRVPAAVELPARVDAVLAVLYLVYNEGYLASSGDDGVRTDLAHEAIRLARLLAALLPESMEATGLLALMLLSEARRPSRFADGVLVPLAEQDRSRWDPALIGEGHALVRTCLRANRPGPYQLLAAVNAVHTDAATAERTDWRQVLALYDQLLVLTPTPVVALNRAVAVAEVSGPLAALEIVDGIGPSVLGGYHALHATRADLLRRLGRTKAARAAYDQAIDHTDNGPERRYLSRMRDGLPR